MFKTDAVILSIDRVRDSQYRMVIFTRDFGKISAWYKKKQAGYGIGDTMKIYIERKGDINIIKNIDILESVPTDNWHYSELIEYLRILSGLMTLLPEQVEHIRIFDDYRELVRCIRSSQGTLGISHYLLFQFRLLRMLGMIDRRDCETSRTLEYIHDHAHTVGLSRLLASRHLTLADTSSLERANMRAIYLATA